jgi:sugar fermentation stimulation protein A
MKLGDRIESGEFMERPNRYLARVKINSEELQAHVPDPGRLSGLMIPGREARLIYNPGPKRKTSYTLALIRHENIWVSVYPVFANKLVGQALAEKRIDCFDSYKDFRAEAKKGKSRFDFRLEFDDDSIGFIEVKSVSLVEEGTGKFPDAPTERGRKHLRELIELKKDGYRSSVMFVSQRSDTRKIIPNAKIDPEFAKILKEAEQCGVELYGYNCRVTKDSISLNQRVEVSTDY